VGDPRVTVTRALVGSPVYMSPEQMRGSQHIDARTDIWSIGIILYELLGHGRSPFEAPTLPAICARVLDKEPPPLRKIRRDLPRALEAVVLRCLEKEPERRFRTVADLADALVPFGPPDSRARAHRVRRILDGASSDRQSIVGPRRRGSSWLFAGAVTAAALMALAAILLEHPSYVQSTVSAAHSWTTSAVHRVEAEAVTMGVAPPSPSDAPLTAFVEPVAPSAEPTVRPAEPLPPPSPEPRASLVEAPVPTAYAPAAPAPVAPAPVEAAGPYPAKATALDAGLAKAARARALHHASSTARPSKTYVLEPIPEPDPAPPIVAPPPVKPPVVKPPAAATAQPTEEPTPYDEPPTPDFGGRQ
jgi:serine/threonine-protein kinase